MSRRQEKVAALLQQQAAVVLSREFAVKNVVLSVVRVDVSPDLKNARVHVSIVGSEPAGLRDRLENALPGLMAKNLARRTDLRSIPHLRIVFDDSSAYAKRMSNLIDSASIRLTQQP